MERCPFPFPSERPLAVPAALAGQTDRPALLPIELPTGDPAWLALGFDEVRTVLTDPRFSRAAACAEGAPRLRPLPPDRSTILAMDPPEHSRLHKLVVRAFSARRIDALRPYLERTAGELVTTMTAAGPPADVISGLAVPLPLAVICQLLGVPYADRSRFADLTATMLSLSGPGREAVAAARQELNDYLADLVDRRRARPGGDLISELVAASDERGLLGADEIVVFAGTLLIAGYHTTSAAIGSAVLTLLRQPDRLETLAADPSRSADLVPELLRYSVAPASGGNLRVVTADVELGGVTLRAGTGVLPSVVGANRDPRRFSDPDAFRPDRDEVGLTFGAGPHYCLGARLATLELEVALTALVRRCGAFGLAVTEDRLQVTGSAIRNLTALPIVWKA